MMKSATTDTSPDIVVVRNWARNEATAAGRSLTEVSNHRHQSADRVVSSASRLGKQRGDGIHGALGFGAVRHLGVVVIAVVVVVADHLKNQAVAARHEPDVLIEETVVHFRLRDHARQLTAHRHERLIAEQRARAVAGGIDQVSFPSSARIHPGRGIP